MSRISQRLRVRVFVNNVKNLKKEPSNCAAESTACPSSKEWGEELERSQASPQIFRVGHIIKIQSLVVVRLDV